MVFKLPTMYYVETSQCVPDSAVVLYCFQHVLQFNCFVSYTKQYSITTRTKSILNNRSEIINSCFRGRRESSLGHLSPQMPSSFVQKIFLNGDGEGEGKLAAQQLPQRSGGEREKFPCRCRYCF